MDLLWFGGLCSFVLVGPSSLRRNAANLWHSAVMLSLMRLSGFLWLARLFL
jgi:hypothetical protein